MYIIGTLVGDNGIVMHHRKNVSSKGTLSIIIILSLNYITRALKPHSVVLPLAAEIQGAMSHGEW